MHTCLDYLPFCEEGQNSVADEDIRQEDRQALDLRAYLLTDQENEQIRARCPPWSQVLVLQGALAVRRMFIL